MRIQDLGPAGIVALVLALMLFLPGFQVRKIEKITFTGVIEEVQKELRFLTVSGAKVSITPKTKIVDDNGNPQKANALSGKSAVTIEASQNSEGIFAEKIIIKVKP
jgi:hypothetical protein